MFEAQIDILNRIAGMITASLVDTSLLTLAALAIAVLAARGKGWSAATRYALWWLILGFVIAAPFVWDIFITGDSSPANNLPLRTALRSRLCLSQFRPQSRNRPEQPRLSRPLSGYL
jgi:hypothetical protein